MASWSFHTIRFRFQFPLLSSKIGKEGILNQFETPWGNQESESLQGHPSVDRIPFTNSFAFILKFLRRWYIVNYGQFAVYSGVSVYVKFYYIVTYSKNER